MLEAQPVLFRRSPSRRRMLRPGVGTDDRGGTSLHVKGDFKLVSFFSFINPSFMLLLLLLQNPSFKRQALLGNLNYNNAASYKSNGGIGSSSSSSDSLSFSDSDSASSSRSHSEAWPMCGALQKKMICFKASFECAASIHGLDSVAVNMVCCFILDEFFVAGQLLEEVCGVHY
ncbi:hypothetical protein HN51_031547 [Arachis hypogaea]|uniref:Uncharacterized protein LOC107469699 isoform X2 n=1 Tax=Arachis duranensis TaxID=130453 RepID=A0A6P5MT20_ARADU|nr:uncharacterized protein LOC107469699 isoform X2 [Arachis duranensis]XP_025623173.1 uncharacterized protein LOC112715618 isoform X1 [Arachis hypogaea]XP_025623174.1 uncharacterized protein LOC112715618 isoform X1 [Arachis hypogaea]